MLRKTFIAVINRCDLIVPELVQMLLSVWQHRKLNEFCIIPERSGQVNEEDEMVKLTANNTLDDAERSVVHEEDIIRFRERKQQEGE